MKTFLILLTFAVCAFGQTGGLGKSTLTCLDKDGDGYGVGPGCLGQDADDYDAGVHSAAQAISKYGTLGAFLSYRGYTPSHIWYLAPQTASPNCVASIGSCVGNDSTGVEDDINHPFVSWAAIASHVKPNHMVMMRDNWNGRITAVSGTSGNPVIYLSFPGEAAYLNPATYAGATILMLDVSWIVIDGVKATQTACLSGGSTASYPSATTFHDDVFQNLECTSGGGSQGLAGFGAFNGLVNITIQDNVFHDNSGPNQQHEIYIGSRTIPSSNVYVRRNIAYNSNSYPGIQFNGRVTNLVMEDNLVYNIPASAYSLMEGVSNSFFRNNISFNVAGEGLAIVNYDGDCYISGSSGICPYDQTGNVIENNTFYTGAVGPGGAPTVQPALEIVNLTSGCPIPVGNCTQRKVGNLGGNLIRNNIFVSNDGGTANYPPVVFPMCTLASAAAGGCLLDTSETTLSTTTFANNIFWNTGGHGGPGVVGTGPNPGYGYTAHTCANLAAGLAISSGCINADPLFVAANPLGVYATASAFNFALQPGSPALAAGTSVGAPATDIWGTPRANPPAIGAYEPTSQGAHAVLVSSLACAPASLGSMASAACTVILGQPAGTGGVTIALSSNAVALTVPPSVPVAAGGTTATFTATAGTISAGQTVTLTASLNGGSQTTSVILVAPAVLSSVSCSPGALSSGASASCAATLSQAAGSGGATVALSSSTSALTVPATASVAAGATTARFTATAGTISTALTAIVTAALNGGSQTTSLALAAAGAPASSSWQQLSNTMLTSACPASNFGGIQYAFSAYCGYVINAWGGALADTKRNRLVIWGGGHSDYQGNEVYALNLASAAPAMTRLTDPSAWNYSLSYEVDPDGNPTSRHTYNDLVYLPAQDALFSFSGCLPSGECTNHTWTFTFADNKWHAQDPVNGFDPTTITPSITAAACAYDPNTQTVFCINGNTNYLLQYNPATNTYTKLSTTDAYPLAATAAIDPVRKLMIFMGNAADGVAFKVSAIDISGADPTYAIKDWTTQVTGCAGMGVNWPGFTYDSAIGKFLGYPNQGNTVYIFDAGAKSCVAQSFANGPQIAPASLGTYGRFQYFPSLDALVLVNDPTQNAYSVRLSSGAPPTAPSSPCDLNGDGKVDSLDVQIAINQALGVSACSTAALTGNGQCNVVDVQRVINASLGGVCMTGLN